MKKTHTLALAPDSLAASVGDGKLYLIPDYRTLEERATARLESLRAPAAALSPKAAARLLTDIRFLHCLAD